MKNPEGSVELHLNSFSDYLPKRNKISNKGNFGHVVIIGGDIGYSGAVRLAAKAALRTGAGLVSVATHPNHAAVLNAACPEIMSHPVSTTKEIRSLLSRATVVVFGPGLGMQTWGIKLYQLVKEIKQPLILDADGLNQLAKNPFRNENWIITPHPGEAARLLDENVAMIQQDRVAAVTKLQKTFGGVAILKGAGTLIKGESESPAICTHGNPGMATAGMGDVLSGVLGGLAAQGIPLDISAQLGVLIHAMAGDLAAQKGERGMIASDLMPHIRKLVNQ